MCVGEKQTHNCVNSSHCWVRNSQLRSGIQKLMTSPPAGWVNCQHLSWPQVAANSFAATEVSRHWPQELSFPSPPEETLGHPGHQNTRALNVRNFPAPILTLSIRDRAAKENKTPAFCGHFIIELQLQSNRMQQNSLTPRRLSELPRKNGKKNG